MNGTKFTTGHKPMRLTLPVHARLRHWIVDTWNAVDIFEPLVFAALFVLALGGLVSVFLLVILS